LKDFGLAIKSYRNEAVCNICEVKIRVYVLAPCHEDAWRVECKNLCILNSTKDEVFVLAFLTPVKIV